MSENVEFRIVAVVFGVVTVALSLFCFLHIGEHPIVLRILVATLTLVFALLFVSMSYWCWFGYDVRLMRIAAKVAKFGDIESQKLLSLLVTARENEIGLYANEGLLLDATQFSQLRCQRSSATARRRNLHQELLVQLRQVTVISQ